MIHRQKHSALEKFFTKRGFDVIEAANGADGVTMAQAELPDLVLMDVVMPGVNGFQATRQISRGELPNIFQL